MFPCPISKSKEQKYPSAQQNPPAKKLVPENIAVKSAELVTREYRNIDTVKCLENSWLKKYPNHCPDLYQGQIEENKRSFTSEA